jgi:hypothetical protein
LLLIKNMNLFESIMTVIEEKFIPHKRSKVVKRKTKRARRRAHKGTNWKIIKPRRGFKRVKLPNSKRYVLVRLKQNEKASKRRLMRAVGKRKDFKEKK